MREKRPFDPVQAAFWLIAAILGVQCFVIIAGALSCLVYVHTIISSPDIVCDPKDRMSTLLANALAAALALLASFMQKRPPDDPPPPPPPPPSPPPS